MGFRNMLDWSRMPRGVLSSRSWMLMTYKSNAWLTPGWVTHYETFNGWFRNLKKRGSRGRRAKRNRLPLTPWHMWYVEKIFFEIFFWKSKMYLSVVFFVIIRKPKKLYPQNTNKNHLWGGLHLLRTIEGPKKIHFETSGSFWSKAPNKELRFYLEL